MFVHRSALFVCLVVAAVSALAQDTVTLRYKPVVGRTYRYSTQVDISASGPMSMKSKLLMVAALGIQDISDGTIKTVQSIEFARVAGDKAAMPESVVEQMKKAKIGADIDHLGKVLSQKELPGTNSMGNPLAAFGSSAIGIELPKDPVGVGGKWDQIVDFKKALGQSAAVAQMTVEKPIAMHYEVKSFGEVGGRRVAFVEWTMDGLISMGGGESSGPSGKLSITGGGKTAVDLATGFNLKTETNIDISIKISGLPAGSEMADMKQSVGVKQSLLEPGKLGA